MTAIRTSSFSRRPEDLIDEIAIQSYIISAAFRRHGDRLAGDFGLTQARMQVMRMALGDGLTVPRIARRLGVSRQNVQRIADAIVADGFAIFKENPDHKGSMTLVLTDEGLRLMRDWSAHTKNYRLRLAEEVGKDSLLDLLSRLRELGDALNRMSDFESE